MIRVYIDEDAMSAAIVTALRSNGFDVLTAEEASMRGRSDPDHLRFATAEGRVLYGFNRKDYMKLHRDLLQAGVHHAGIVLLGTRSPDIGRQLRGLIAVAHLRGHEGMQDWLEVI